MNDEIVVGDELEVKSGLFRYTKVRIKELRQKQMVLVELLTERHGMIEGDLIELPVHTFDERQD